jgi:hypothetical protein
MIATCGVVTSQELVAYWADDLSTTEVDRLDEHLIGCPTCSMASARVSSITEALRSLIPPFLGHAALDGLRARGHRIRENPLRPDIRRAVVFDRATDLLIHKLEGLELMDATSVGIVISVEETGDVLLEEPNVPFDRASGEVLVACQPHFARLPPNIVVEVRIRNASSPDRLARYPIPHIFESRTDRA